MIGIVFVQMPRKNRINCVASFLFFATLFITCAENVQGQFTNFINLPPDPNIGDIVTISSGTQLNVFDGGSIGNHFIAGSGTEVNFFGGTIGFHFGANDGSIVNVSGGSIGGAFTASRSSKVYITGGSVGGQFEARINSLVEISGGIVGDGLEADFSSVINISGGTVGDAASASDNGIINISGGTVGNYLALDDGGEVHISGGSVGDSLRITGGSGSISGGSVGKDMLVTNLVNISGGSIGSGAVFGRESRANISGGVFEGNVHALSESLLNIVGTEFYLGGNLLINLNFGESFTILDRDVTLDGKLADGSQFSFDLNSNIATNQDFFSSDGSLTVTLVKLVPEPTSLTLLGASGLFLLVLRCLTRFSHGSTFLPPTG